MLHGFAATPAVVSTLNAVLVGVIIALIGLQLGIGAVGALILAVVGVVVTFAIFARWGMRLMKRGLGSLRPIFPSPAGDDQA
jgi:O-antigen/teichoic acid export membrane protein